MNRREAMQAAIAGTAAAVLPESKVNLATAVLREVYSKSNHDGTSVSTWIMYSDGRTYWTTAPFSKVYSLIGEPESVVMEMLWK